MISSGLRVSSQPPHLARKACVGASSGVSVHPSASAARKATSSFATASNRRSASSRVIIFDTRFLPFEDIDYRLPVKSLTILAKVLHRPLADRTRLSPSAPAGTSEPLCAVTDFLWDPSLHHYPRK